MATKAEERKALLQIIQIVEGLGEGSYIGTAFEGCFDIARENIENDWGGSIKQCADDLANKLAEAKDTIQCRENELADKEKEIRDLRKSVEFLTKARDELLSRLRETEKVGCAIADEKIALQTKSIQQEDEILHLKAKLYDFMTAKED